MDVDPTMPAATASVNGHEADLTAHEGQEPKSQPAELDPARAANQAKFELELEMLCALANPHYLLELASSGLLDPAAAAGEGEETEAPFVAFVRYLAYWEQADYAKYIIYPQALHHRRLLLEPTFRRALRTQGPAVVQSLADGQFQHWRTWRSEKAHGTATTMTTTGDEAPHPAAQTGATAGESIAATAAAAV